MTVFYTKYAREMHEKGTITNGCGSGVISKFLCFLALKFINKSLNVVWYWHDLEYAYPNKHLNHKIRADAYARMNINNVLGITLGNKKQKRLRMFSKIIHLALIIGGESSYLQSKKLNISE